VSHVIKQQRAYVTRRNDPDNARFVQREAEILALQNGDLEEAARRRYSEQNLASKARKRAEIKPIAFHIIRELGSRDSIGNMLRDRFLEERHGRTALRLRDYMVHRQVHFGSGAAGERVDGGRGSDPFARTVSLRRGSQAVDAGEATLPSLDFVKPITGLVCGHITIRQASGQLRGRTKDVENRIKGALKAYLEAAEPFFGGGS
jgi:hypothetical protein